MATTKKSTKANTKTAAARAATPKKVTSKKTTPKAAVKPASVAVAPNNLKNLNIISVIVSVLGAVAAALLMSNKSYELVSGLMVKNELASGTATNFVPAVHHVYDLPIRAALVTILALSAVVPLLHLTLKKDRYVAAVRNKVNTWRWLDVAVISALMLEVTALLSGINEVLTLKLLASFMLLSGALAWVAEKRNIQANRPVKSELYIGIAASVLPWLIIASYAIGTWAYGLVRAPWYVYALYVTLIAGFGGYCLTLKRWVKGRNNDYVTAEKNYLTLGILTKLAFAVILILAFKK